MLSGEAAITPSDTTQVGSRRDSLKLRVVIETQAWAGVHLGAFYTSHLPQCRCQATRLLNHFTDLRGRQDGRSFSSLKTHPRFIRLSRANTRRIRQSSTATPHVPVNTPHADDRGATA